ncbi:antibiotic biosynthesis monooxygenase family protein [Agromyces bauzanensis]|nr:antibiotic biosynthesis monooxygenase [Agromyces bauzanensis]
MPPWCRPQVPDAAAAGRSGALCAKPGSLPCFGAPHGRSREAAPIISSMPGFVDLRLTRSIETPNTYLLLVHWESVEAHEQGFRGSPDYAR